MVFYTICVGKLEINLLYYILLVHSCKEITFRFYIEIMTRKLDLCIFLPSKIKISRQNFCIENNNFPHYLTWWDFNSPLSPKNYRCLFSVTSKRKVLYFEMKKYGFFYYQIHRIRFDDKLHQKTKYFFLDRSFWHF